MDRERLTITLKKSILERIDNLIDGTKIRNRSHAIEYLITQSLNPKVSQAILLAGGKGLNMRPFTFEMPKGLFPVAGKPILEHIVERLVKYEIRDIIFSIGHLGEKIKQHFGDGSKFGVRIRYVDETHEAGTGGALNLAKKYITTDTFLVSHGDILIDIDLSDFIAFHKEQDALATIALSSVVDPSSFGEVVLHGAKITQFVEKPKKDHHTSQLISCGLYIFEKKIFNLLPHTDKFLLEDIFPHLASTQKLAGFLFEGRFLDIGSPASYARAIQEWKSK